MFGSDSPPDQNFEEKLNVTPTSTPSLDSSSAFKLEDSHAGYYVFHQKSKTKIPYENIKQMVDTLLPSALHKFDQQHETQQQAFAEQIQGLNLSIADLQSRNQALENANASIRHDLDVSILDHEQKTTFLTGQVQDNRLKMNDMAHLINLLRIQHLELITRVNNLQGPAALPVPAPAQVILEHGQLPRPANPSVRQHSNPHQTSSSDSYYGQRLRQNSAAEDLLSNPPTFLQQSSSTSSPPHLQSSYWTNENQHAFLSPPQGALARTSSQPGGEEEDNPRRSHAKRHASEVHEKPRRPSSSNR